MEGSNVLLNSPSTTSPQFGTSQTRGRLNMDDDQIRAEAAKIVFEYSGTLISAAIAAKKDVSWNVRQNLEDSVYRHIIKNIR